MFKCKMTDKIKQILKHDTSIISRVIFTKSKEFYYMFYVIQKGVVKTKKRANSVKEFDKVYEELTNEYNSNIIYDYTDLTKKQLEYLAIFKNDNETRLDLELLENTRIDNLFKD